MTKPNTKVEEKYVTKPNTKAIMKYFVEKLGVVPVGVNTQRVMLMGQSQMYVVVVTLPAKFVDILNVRHVSGCFLVSQGGNPNIRKIFKDLGSHSGVYDPGNVRANKLPSFRFDFKF